mgnify:CR=1 FL=1
MNEYSVITYAIKEKHIKEGIEGGMLDESFHCTEKANDLYSFVRLEDIEALNAQAALAREKDNSSRWRGKLYQAIFECS